MNQLFVDGVWRRCTQCLYGLLTICYTLPVNSLTRANINILYIVNAECRGNGKERVCLAGHNPASHPIEGVGTQRVALVDDSMRLRVKARKETKGEHVETYMQRSNRTCVGKRRFCSSKKG